MPRRSSGAYSEAVKPVPPQTARFEVLPVVAHQAEKRVVASLIDPFECTMRMPITLERTRLRKRASLARRALFRRRRAETSQNIP